MNLAYIYTYIFNVHIVSQLLILDMKQIIIKLIYIKNMARIVSFYIFIYTSTTYAQTGINTTSPDINAVLDIFSNSKGLLIPRLTTSEMTALGNKNPAKGMMIYNTDLECIQVYSTSTNLFECLATQVKSDPSKDAWENNVSSTRVELSSTSDGTTARPTGTEVVVKDDGKVGIGTTTPQKKLHVSGPVQITGEFSVGGDATTIGNAGTEGQFLTSNGPGVAPTWQAPAGIIPSSNGTVIAVNGKLLIAQEIIVQMTDNFTRSPASTTAAIGNLTTEVIDNNNTYSASSTSNSFKVSEVGIYQVTMNMQVATSETTNPVIGIWDNNGGTSGTGAWVARVNDYISKDILQTFTLITSISLDPTHTYLFRVSTNSGSITIRAESSGTTGSGPVSQASIKRLR